jgi:hypothetical protein
VDEIVDIATVPGNPSCVYYASVSRVYCSEDAGRNFMVLGSVREVPGIME